jgi:hypothetical protein
MEGNRPAGERNVPEGLPPSPQKLRADALTRLFNSLADLAELAVPLARELLEQAEAEKVENAERRARMEQRRGGL